MRPDETATYPGEQIQTEVLMEPGEKYENPDGDFYNIDIFENPDGSSFLIRPKGDQCPTGHLSFSSLGQLEEFHEHLGDYIRKEKLRRLRE